MDVITQLSAVRSSIDRVMGMIVADNLKNCFENPDSNPEEQAAKLEQAIKMIIKSKGMISMKVVFHIDELEKWSETGKNVKT